MTDAIGREWTLRYEARPLAHNAERKLSHYERAEVMREWRQAFWVLAREQRIPRLGRVAVDVRQYVWRGKLPDTGSCAPAAKAGCDGALVDGGIVPDDTGEFVAWIRYFPPMRAKADAMTLTVLEIL